MHEEKQAARLKLQTQVRAAEDDFLQAVATSQGWGPEVMTAETPSHLSTEAAEKARKDHRRGLLRKARDVVGLQRQALLHDADLRLPRSLTISWQCQGHDGKEEATDQKGYDRYINKPQYRDH